MSIETPRKRAWDILYEIDKNRYGCVVRTLESFFGKTATEEEWQLRIDSIRLRMKQLEWVNVNFQGAEVRDAVRKKVVEADFEDVRRYINLVSANDSPLGKAIRNRGYEFRRMPGGKVLKNLKDERQLIAMWGFMREGYNGYIGHMAHLVKGDRQGIAYSISDRRSWPIERSIVMQTFS